MLEIHPVPAFNDNYLWLFHPPGSRGACVVDPGDAEAIKRRLESAGLELEAILLTHHHGDHIGGVNELLARYPVPVYGPRSRHIPMVDQSLREGDELSLFGHAFRVLEIPGHTLDHIAYFCADAGDAPILFCGDTLFAGGCGRVFEGDAPMMYRSLRKLAALPPETRVYCAHEYTLANLRFARAVLPGDADLAAREAAERGKRERELPTVPSRLADELATNPFLRCEDAAVAAAARRHSGRELHGPEEVFAAIRGWKDSF